jgi:predicted enzyme related to lactoylglutathione lyase
VPENQLLEVIVAITLPSVVLFVDDVQRLTRFYQALAQMTVVHEAPDHAVLGIDGFQLVIHALPPGATTDGAASQPVQVREDSYMKLCLPVPSIAEARAIAAAHGGAIAPVAREWAARGFRACDGHDPEGNVVQVREAAE